VAALENQLDDAVYFYVLPARVTAEYERIEIALKAAGYTATDDSFRWKRAAGLGLNVEFFCPASDDRPAGTLFRPRAARAPMVKHNMGSTLSAVALDAGDAISVDAQTVERDVVLGPEVRKEQPPPSKRASPSSAPTSKPRLPDWQSSLGMSHG
jgi:hypothetical protein